MTFFSLHTPRHREEEEGLTPCRSTRLMACLCGVGANVLLLNIVLLSLCIPYLFYISLPPSLPPSLPLPIAMSHVVYVAESVKSLGARLSAPQDTHLTDLPAFALPKAPRFRSINIYSLNINILWGGPQIHLKQFSADQRFCGTHCISMLSPIASRLFWEKFQHLQHSMNLMHMIQPLPDSKLGHTWAIFCIPCHIHWRLVWVTPSASHSQRHLCVSHCWGNSNKMICVESDWHWKSQLAPWNGRKSHLILVHWCRGLQQCPNDPKSQSKLCLMIS